MSETGRVEAPLIVGAELTDRSGSWPVQRSEVRAGGPVITMVTERVATPDGDTMTRDFVRHPGSVGIIAVDDADHLVLVRQYRHPVRHTLVEPPAGLLDAPGEDPLRAAQRELAEEVGLAATRWRVLVDAFTSPGCSQEAIRIYLAEGLRSVPRPEGFAAHGEEAQMDTVRCPLGDVVAAVLAGRVHNPTLVMGALALAAVRAGAADRPDDAPWPARNP